MSTTHTARILGHLDAPLSPPVPSRDERLSAAVERQRISREARRIVDAEERPPAPMPVVQSLADLLAEPDDPITWRLTDWQPVGTRVMLTAAAKTGKTTLTGALVRSLVDGDPWLGEAAVTPITGTVCVLDTEMSRRQLRAWLRDQRIQDANRVVVIPLRGSVATLDLLVPETRARWAALLRRHGVAYLVLDCVRPILDALGLEEATEAGRLLTALDALLAEAGIAEACIVHHMGHTGERARGDSRLRDWPDVEWRMVRHDETPSSARYLSAYGRDVDVPETALQYDAATRRLTVAGGSRRDHHTHEALGAIVAVLRERGVGLSLRAIEDELRDSDHRRAQVREALALGVADGILSTSPGPHRSTLHHLRGAA